MAETGTVEMKVEMVAEFTVAKLDVKPGDVVVVRSPFETAEEVRQFGEWLTHWSHHHEMDVKWLVLPKEADINAVLHGLSEDEIAKAGAGGWPHEGRSGIIAGMSDDSATET